MRNIRIAAIGTLVLVITAANTSGARAAIDPDTIDMLVPTKNYNAACEAGMYADVVCQTDNSTVYYYMDSSGEYELESEDRAAVKSALALYHNQTDLKIVYDSTPAFSGSGETDVIYQEGSFGLDDNYVGITWCNDPVNGTRHECDQTYIRIRGNGKYSVKVAAHESGHAFGLTHGAQAYPSQQQCGAAMGIMRAALSCMTSSELGSVAIANINKVY